MVQEIRVDRDELKKKLDRTFPMPQTMAKILAALNNPETGAAELEKIFKFDPSFTLKILALANSSYYGSTTKVSNIRAAITLLGLNMIKSLALHASVHDLFRADMVGPNFSGYELWKHSVGVGVCAKMLSRRLRMGNAEDFFTLGILHDVGLLVEYQFYPDLFQEVLKRLEEKKHGLTHVEEMVMGIHHGMLSQLLCEKWKLPHSICSVVCHHHHPMAAHENERPATAAVYIANTIVKKARFGFHYEDDEPLMDVCLKQLNLEAVDVDILQEDFEQEVLELSPFLT